MCVCVCQCGCVRHGVLYSLSGNGHLSVSQSASESVFVEFVHGESSVLPIVGERVVRVDITDYIIVLFMLR